MSQLLDDQVLSSIGKSAASPLFHITLFWDAVELDKLLPDGLTVDPLPPEFPLD
jgi:hypothetical protein